MMRRRFLSFPGAARRLGRGLVVVIAAVCPAAAAPGWSLANEVVSLQVAERGAAISALRVAGEPDSWLSVPEGAGRELAGHFLCFDRWGPVTATEAAGGIPFHGEAARLDWVVVARDGPHRMTLGARLQVVGLAIERAVHLPPGGGGGFSIRTAVRNPLADSRPYNLVEHVTLAAMWNEPTVRLSTNAGPGLVHEQGRWRPEATVTWPLLRLAGEEWDLRGAVTRRGRLVVSLVFPTTADWAWVCVHDPVRGRLLGYRWRPADYPWLNLYWHADGRRVLGRALEPGTTGLHQTMETLLGSPLRLDRAVVNHLAAGGERQFALWGFAGRVDGDWGEIVAVERTPAGWVARDTNGRSQILGEGPDDR